MATVITGENINKFRAAMLLKGLEVELRGMRLTSRAPSCYSIIKREYGLKGNKQKVYEQFKALLEKAA